MQIVTQPQQMTHLTGDGGLVLECDTDCIDAVATWLPRYRITDPSRSLPRTQSFATIRVHRAADVAYETPGTTHTLGLAGVSCWIDNGRATMRARHSECRGMVDLVAMHADLEIPAHPGDIAQADVYSMLTLASALLLAKQGSALVHAAAVTLSGDRVWLLAGDTHAGKSTTTLNLMRAGCRYLSDDQVILSAAPSTAITVEGWPRHFHLDIGWHVGRSTGFRNSIDPEIHAADRWTSHGMLGGLIFPFVDAGSPTTVKPIKPADALGRLIRQSPWVMTQLDVAPALLQLLTAAASLPAYELSVGLDTYREHDALRALLP